MAVDTRNKRASAIGIGLIWRSVLPQPDGNVSQSNRRQLAYCYPIVDDVGSFGCAHGLSVYHNAATALSTLNQGAAGVGVYRHGGTALEKAC